MIPISDSELVVMVLNSNWIDLELDWLEIVVKGLYFI